MSVSQYLLHRKNYSKNVIFYSSALKIFESGKFYTETNDEKNIVFNKSVTSLLIDRIKLFTKS